ncbi:heme peroxidase-domain-containing protein [Copromyces sp. CBS 386.78]|nr:heme peroxidase-domain-containing protein [Copromyces sp. CBS 386.78]
MSSSGEQRPLGGHANKDSGNAELQKLNEALSKQRYLAGFHGDALIGDKVVPKVGLKDDMVRIMELKNVPSMAAVLANYLKGNGLDIKAGASLIASMSNNSVARNEFIEEQVKIKYDRMLHPPLSYLGDAFKYRTADGKFNSAMNPHLGQAGAPYAKTVPAKTHPLGALPDPGDLFDRLMAREENGRPSQSGLSSMLVYHATIIIHDIFRTNDNDKSISDTSSYLDLSPLYGFTEEMQRKVRDDKYGLGLLKPDTFAEDRLLRQPPGVCIMLVMYNRYHNYAATQLRRINENGRFRVPRKYQEAKLLAAVTEFVKDNFKDDMDYQQALERFKHANQAFESNGRVSTKEYEDASNALQVFIDKAQPVKEEVKAFYDGHDAAWKKLDDDLFHTARLITCGIYIQVSIHDYLRALMGFHQYDTNFTLDPRVNQSKAKEVSRGLGNQVTVEFNLLYRFHCAISLGDEDYLEKYLEEEFAKKSQPDWNPKEMGLQEFLMEMGQVRARAKNDPVIEPCDIEFGLKNKDGDETREKMAFKRDPITRLFKDEQMVEHLTKVMDEPISNFGPRNVPRSLKAVEIMGIIQARKWGVGTLNDFREFFGMKRHETFESISGCVEIQNALRDLYEHPDKVELYPGIFCESDASQNADPGPSDVDSALWAAIFSDAITLVRSDRFYTVDWNTHSLTSWGMKEVTPDNDVLKSSVFHRLLQRSFPEWFPSTSIRFFHPFYTAQKNAEYAAAQGYGKDFAITPVAKKSGTQTFDTSASNPRKPADPKILTNPEQIMAVLDDDSDNIVHPVRLEGDILPPKVAEVLAVRENGNNEDHGRKPHSEHQGDIDTDTNDLMTYFTTLMRDIIKREFVVMKPGQEKPKADPVYQLDVTRDFAIPVVTRYVADFLGFGHLVKSENNLDARYSEDEIYQHITNCHVYFSYNADETKLPKRRKVFKDSMKFLYELTLDEGNVAEANKFRLTRALQSVASWFWKSAAGDKNPMSELGFKVSEQVLQEQKGDAGRAAAILLLTALDSSYNSVLAFTSVLNSFLTGLYTLAAEKRKPEATAERSCDWLHIQNLALAEFRDVPTNTFDDIKKIVLKEQRRSVKLPIIRKARVSCVVKGSKVSVEKDELIICDIHRGDRKHKDDVSATGVPPPWETKYLSYHTSFTERFTKYHPRHLAANSLTAMIKVLAQLKDLRRGHDTQGNLKKIALDSSYATYTNFMAPQRIRQINAKVREAMAEAKAANKLDKVEELKKKYNLDRLRCPATDTYMTPEWDEMIPFPTTWKVMFNGFGESTYGGEQLPLLKSTKVPDDFPPFYELPDGPSHTGGSLGEPVNPPAPVKQQEELASKKKEGEGGSAAGDSAIEVDGGRRKELPKGVTNGCGIGS